MYTIVASGTLPYIREENILGMYNEFFSLKMRKKFFSHIKGKTSHLKRKNALKKFPLFISISAG
jgi:hypothetical protein